MWPKSYKDYPVDSPLKKQHIEPDKGINGCEMHELNGWGSSYHRPAKRKCKKGFIRAILESIGRRFR